MKYSQDEKALIWFSLMDFLPYKKQAQIITVLGNPGNIFVDASKHRNVFVQIAGKDTDKLLSANEKIVDDYINELNKKGIFCITINSEDYPEKLRNIDSPPFILYCMGDKTLLNSECIAVVGTRTPTAYGRIITEKFTKGLVANGFVIVSGLAYGVDTIAHKAALSSGGKTIAVLGGGFNYIYPAANSNLAKEIAKNSLLISEYKPEFKSTTYSFPQRNRIVAGISLGTLITEAGAKSGALHTKEFALDAGRDVFAVPGNITSSMSEGTNRIIKSASVACVTSYEDIVSQYRSQVELVKKKTHQLDINETILVELLKNDEKSYEFLQNNSGFDSKMLNSYLTTMQIRGIIKKLPGNFYMLV